MNCLSFKEIYELIEKQKDRFYSYWSGFTATSGVILGWFLINQSKLSTSHQLVITFSFILFAYFNLRSIIKVKIRQEYFVKEIKALYDKYSCYHSPYITAILRSFETELDCKVYIYVHLVADAVVLVIIWYPNIKNILLNIKNL